MTMPTTCTTTTTTVATTPVGVVVCATLTSTRACSFATETPTFALRAQHCRDLSYFQNSASCSPSCAPPQPCEIREGGSCRSHHLRREKQENRGCEKDRRGLARQVGGLCSFLFVCLFFVCLITLLSSFSFLFFSSLSPCTFSPLAGPT